MTRHVGGWPNYALWALEDVQACLIEIERLTRDAQLLLAQGRMLESSIVLADVRSKAADGRVILGKARHGEK